MRRLILSFMQWFAEANIKMRREKRRYYKCMRKKARTRHSRIQTNDHKDYTHGLHSQTQTHTKLEHTALTVTDTYHQTATYTMINW